MKNKNTILIITSILALLALSVIQAYLISNTYQLEKDAFIKETKSVISNIDISRDRVLDSLFSDAWGGDLSNHLSDYINKRISKDDVVKEAKLKADSINLIFITYYKKKLEALGLTYDIKFKKTLESIVIFQNNTLDSIYSSTPNTQLKLFGDDFALEDGNTINDARWFTEFDYFDDSGDNLISRSYDLEVRTNESIEIKDWKEIVLKRMTTLLLASLLIFLFVIGLLYYSIKKLINQKKITAVKTDFINNITHELKTPLATLSIASKSLKNIDIQKSKKAFNNTLNIVDRQNNRLQKLIDQVMTNSLSSKDIVLHKEQVIDNLYFNNLIEDFKLSTQHKNISIKNEVYSPEVLIRIDTFHFTTALLNILENAVKYGTESIDIKIKTELQNTNYIIQIQDNGIGISEKNQQYIFDKFYRVSQGNLHNTKGLGLGLYYTNQIIKAHNGSITFTSEINMGSNFIIKIPLN
ncbi:HAMP domain-containing sensor histidine kinase [Pontimicrobium sp. SW4]|uniref:histidine kinase n=1 Tax=Pontimicrobium sp. SW4 TaxID=3153519 RepID=A0AAU7BSW1_9FLAO